MPNWVIGVGAGGSEETSSIGEFEPTNRSVHVIVGRFTMFCRVKKKEVFGMLQRSFTQSGEVVIWQR